MNSYKNVNSFKKNIGNKNKIILKNTSFLNLKFVHKIFDSINFSLLTIIFILSFISLNSQRKWTNVYRNLTITRDNNNNLIEYISKTEQFYINEFDSLNNFKKTTPNDLIYLVKGTSEAKKNFFIKKLKYIHNGLKDSRYQRGY